MKVNIDEYDLIHYCYVCKQETSQPRVIISMSMDRDVNGEIHLHKKIGLEHHGSSMLPDRKDNFRTRTFAIEDETQDYETCAKIVMDYVDREYKITFLKLG
jgi:hypothetical protein